MKHITIQLDDNSVIIIDSNRVEWIDGGFSYWVTLEQFREILAAESRRRKQLKIDTSKDKPCEAA